MCCKWPSSAVFKHRYYMVVYNICDSRDWLEKLLRDQQRMCQFAPFPHNLSTRTDSPS